jgi:NAD(P)-dependent dehydrogenase (short-subunit alcohol dehydrogenase family)
MKGQYGNVVLVTGASSGIGRATAYLLMNHGYRVYGTSRKEQLEGSIERQDGGDGYIKMLKMDVCDEASVQKAVRTIIEETGEIDIVVNNAGMGVAGSVEDTSPEEAYMQFDANFFGMHRVIRQVATVMRKQGRGLIINISSVAARFPIPFQSMYSACKSAVEAMGAALRMELEPFGIKVVSVEPGDTRTGFTGSRVIAAAAGENPSYREKFKKALDVMVNDETNGPGPEVVAKAILRLTGKKNPPVYAAVGIKYKLFIFLNRLVPERFKVYMISLMYGQR